MAWPMVGFWVAMILGVLSMDGVSLCGAEPAELIARFSKAWPPGRTPYRTADDQDSWKAYGVALRELVAAGDAAVPALTKATQDENSNVRALAARALGYLNAANSVPALINLLEDQMPAVAVAAADALGQIQSERGLAALRAAQKKQRNGDVLLHIAKSLARKTPLEPDARRQLLQLDEEQMATAVVGKPAPDFELPDAHGKPWRLSDQRGASAVVLVFIYGDG